MRARECVCVVLPGSSRAASAPTVFLIFCPPQSTQRRRLCFQKHSRLPWWLTKDPQALFPTNLVLRAAHSAELLKYAAVYSFQKSQMHSCFAGSALFFCSQLFRPASNFGCCFNLANFEIVALVPPVKSSAPSYGAHALPLLLTFPV